MTDRLNARIAIPLLAVVGALSGCGGGDTGSTTTPAATQQRLNVRDPAATFHGDRVAEYEQHMRRLSPGRRSRQRYATRIRGWRFD